MIIKLLCLMCLVRITFSQNEVQQNIEDIQEINNNVESGNSNVVESNEINNNGEVEVNSGNDIKLIANDTLDSPPPTVPTNETKRIIACKPRNSTINDKYEIEMTNGTRLLELLIPDSEITNKETEAQCTIVMFYSRLCPFSAMAAPHFNALARSFPDIKIAAIDALTHHGFNTQYGIVGVPTLIIFHNGRPVAKFNGTEYTIHAFVKFITTYTGIKEDVIAVHSQDFQGPVPSITDKEVDYFLVLSWMFITVCSIFFISKSFLWNVIIEKIKNIWREAEAQHDHIE